MADQISMLRLSHFLSTPFIKTFIVFAVIISLPGCGRINELEEQVVDLEAQVESGTEEIERLELRIEELEEKLDAVSDALQEVDYDLILVERQSALLESDFSFYVQSAVRSLRSSVDSAISEAN